MVREPPDFAIIRRARLCGNTEREETGDSLRIGVGEICVHDRPDVVVNCSNSQSE